MYKKSKFSDLVNDQIKTELFGVLAEASDYDNPTIDWIKARSIYLANFTPQKLSRSLNEMVEMGVVGKGKLKNGRMVYRLRTEYPSTPDYVLKEHEDEGYFPDEEDVEEENE